MHVLRITASPPCEHAPIACDRELIYKSLRSTFGSSAGQMDEDAALDAFNAYVRETLARSIDRNFRQHSMILRNALVTYLCNCHRPMGIYPLGHCY